MEKRVTSENITELKENEVFVFGSNENGFHGAGAAKLAKEKFGAIEGKGFGPAGQTFAIPTKDWAMDQIPYDALECFVMRFIGYALRNPEKHFLVTQIGCGLAGFTPKEVAPFFNLAQHLPNVSLPQCFLDVLTDSKVEEIIKDMSIVYGREKNEI